MTFLEKLQAHKGGLIKITIYDAQETRLDGIGMICGVELSTLGRRDRRWVSLLIDGSVQRFLLNEEDVQFL